MVSPILLQELPHPSQRQTLAGLFNTFYILVSVLPLSGRSGWLLRAARSFTGFHHRSMALIRYELHQ